MIIQKPPACANHFCIFVQYSAIQRYTRWCSVYLMLWKQTVKKGVKKTNILIMGVNHISRCQLWGFSLNMLNLCSKLRNALCRFAFLIQQSCVLLQKPREVKYENTQLGCRANTHCRAHGEAKSMPVSKDMAASIPLSKLDRFMELKSPFFLSRESVHRAKSGFGNAFLLCSCQEALELALNSNVDQCEWW